MRFHSITPCLNATLYFDLDMTFLSTATEHSDTDAKSDLQAAIIGARDSVLENKFPLRAEAIASEVRNLGARGNRALDRCRSGGGWKPRHQP